MSKFCEQISQLRENLSREIKSVMSRHDVTEVELSDEDEENERVYVICFDDDGYCYDCVVTKIINDNGLLTIEAVDKSSDDRYIVAENNEIGARFVEWLDEILDAVTETLNLKKDNENEKKEILEQE